MIDPQRVHDYLEYAMGDVDRRRFEEELARDPAARDELLDQVRINLALAALCTSDANKPVLDSVMNAVSDRSFAAGVVRDLKRILAEQEKSQDLTESLRGVRRRNLRWWPAVVAAALVIMASLWIYQNPVGT
jgi:hypothetical protein